VVNDTLTLVTHVSHAPSFANLGATETLWSGTAIVSGPRNWPAPGWGSYLSGEVGRQWMGVIDAGIDLPDYAFWNVGVGLTYKAFTFDLRYHDTTLSKEECAVLTGDLGAIPGGIPSAANPLGLRSNWCGAAIVGKLSFDLSLAKL
jgi:hypothetical protein